MKKITLIAALTLFFIIAILPLLLLFIDSFICNGRLSLASYQTALFDTRRLGLLNNSLIIASGATVGSLLIGAPCAFLMTRTDLAINKYVRYLWFIPLIIPPHVNAIAWIYLLGTNGVVNLFVKRLLPQTDIFFNIYTLSGVIFVLTLSYFPVIVILINSGLCSADRKLEDAGSLYLPVIDVFRKITLPLIRPHLMAGGLLVFIFAVSDYGVSSLLRVNTYPAEIFAYFSAFYDSKAAAALATPIIAIICLLALLQWRCMRDREYITIGSGVSSACAFALGRWQIPACGFVLSIISIAVAAPLSILMVESGSLQTFQIALKTAYEPITNSLIISLTAATGAIIISFFIAYIIENG
jgi:iron(III) transport system permease protein